MGKSTQLDDTGLLPQGSGAGTGQFPKEGAASPSSLLIEHNPRSQFLV